MVSDTVPTDLYMATPCPQDEFWERLKISGCYEDGVHHTYSVLNIDDEFLKYFTKDKSMLTKFPEYYKKN